MPQAQVGYGDSACLRGVMGGRGWGVARGSELECVR